VLRWRTATHRPDRGRVVEETLSGTALGSGFLQFVGLHVEEFRLARETDSLFFEDRHQHLSELFLLLA
jgi:hypothetical protein